MPRLLAEVRGARVAASESRNAALEDLYRLARQWEQIAGALDANAEEWRRRSTSEQPFVTQVLVRQEAAHIYRTCARGIRALLSPGNGSKEP